MRARKLLTAATTRIWASMSLSNSIAATEKSDTAAGEGRELRAKIEKEKAKLVQDTKDK